MPNVTNVLKHFPSPVENFSTTLASTISAGATTVPLNSLAGYTHGNVAVMVIEPGTVRQQVCTGLVDTNGVQLTSVVWTEGTNVSHTAGSTVVDYVTATDMNMIRKGILVNHTQEGYHKTLHDQNGNEWIQQSVTPSAVNYLQVGNAAAGGDPWITVDGDDTNIDLNLYAKGTGKVLLPDNTVTYGDLLTTIFSGQIATAANAGTAGGTTNYLNLGGLKICWGLTAVITTTAGGFTDPTVVFPTTYAAAPVALTDATAHTSAAKQFSYTPALPSTTGMTTRLQNVDAAGGTARIHWLTVGT